MIDPWTLTGCVVGAVVVAAVVIIARRRRYSTTASLPVAQLIIRHFAPIHPTQLSVSDRQFPMHVRADLQRALEELIEELKVLHFTGVRREYEFFGIDFASLTDQQNMPATATPPQYEAIDIGEDVPVRCLRNGLWLAEADGLRCAVLLAQAVMPGSPGFVRISIASTNTPQGTELAERLAQRLEKATQNTSCYRGKILSFEVQESFQGLGSGITVHRLRTVERDQVILPARTLDLLDRNVIRFVGQRDRLRQWGLPTRKGLLFYGPPGTGKTHTIHYLARALPDHTTLLIVAEQVQHLNHYLTLARLLQPALVVIEDVDLIARDRETHGNACTESLLNKLLNEMDGLREDADVLFILTTNRPESLEQALASRPGRVDQAIEFPLPDEESRRKLVRLYAGGLTLDDGLIHTIAARTDRVSAAFIRELMRRSLQFHIERGGQGKMELPDVEAALDELLFAGGSLNLKLLGTALTDHDDRYCGK